MRSRDESRNAARKPRCFARALGFLLAAAALASCGDSGGGESPGRPFDALVAEGTCPVEVTGISRSIGPVPAFRGTLRNLSDRPIEAVRWTVVFTGTGGTALGEPSDGGFADASPIPPGGEAEGMFPASSDEAVGARIVVRDLVTTQPNPMGEKFGPLPRKWTNPRHDADVRAASGR